ncbi:Hydantoinase/oxoprolinase [Thalassoglobus neptunius]|uniref:Hydantoinase/oxoprolinase n=1 Tax=Thalassoglobus neptunius TaxID=1938619 RepID=A0A5C5WPG6_9PLAN|nr:hydantoinase/oxoprolinase family protein [Thalassoglobus neptunius]TWT52320.1 Hydantoinase/oxoprolinase [Thalassoglobus neptunius]
MSEHLGLDIGGAHLKASDGFTCRSVPFPLWKSPEKLTDELRRLIGQFPQARQIAATMTGELADCFESRAEGVREILSSLEEAAGSRAIRAWQTGGEFFTVAEADEFFELVASANWHALATWVGRADPGGNVLLVDFGSTTTDVIPIESEIPQPAGRTDLERLTSRELIYTGCRRTSLCSLCHEVEIDGRRYGVAAEHFATTHDVALVLETVAESPDSLDTADGRPADREHAFARLARMLCTDKDAFERTEWIRVAEQFQRAQEERIGTAIETVLNRWRCDPTVWVLAGEGEAILRKVIDNRQLAQNSRELVSLNEMLGASHSQAACAFALSRLSEERKL